MNDTEKTSFLASLAHLCGCCPASTIAEHVPESYWRYLRHLPLWAIRQAMSRALRESQAPSFVPGAEDIRRHAEVFAKHPPANKPEHPLGLLGEGNGSPLADNNQFERLAKKWESDIANGNAPEMKEAAAVIAQVAAKVGA